MEKQIAFKTFHYLIIFCLIVFCFQTSAQTQVGQDILGGQSLGVGESLAISDDGIVIATANSTATTNTDVIVFEYVSGNWVQKGSVISGLFNETYNSFGDHVSLSSDGSVLAISDPSYYDIEGNLSYVKVYSFINGDWVQIGNTIEHTTSEVYTSFGSSVDLSHDGTRLAIGCPNCDVSAIDSGLVIVYEFINGSWQQLGNIIALTGDDSLGFDLSFANNGNRLAVSAPQNNSNGFNAAGEVRVYDFFNNTWTLVGQVIEEPSELGFFGAAVDMSEDGGSLIVGSPNNDTNGTNSGQVNIYRLINGIWTQIGNTFNGNQANDQLGHRVNISDDGEIIIFSAIGHDAGTGYVNIYKYENNQWLQIDSTLNGIDNYVNFGKSLTFAKTAKIIAIGSGSGFNSTFGQGIIEVFDISNILSINSRDISEHCFIPNPITNQLNINCEDYFNITKIKIYSYSGREIFSMDKDYNRKIVLDKGLYILKIFSTQGNWTKKIMFDY